MLFKERMPDCVPEMYRSMQDDADHAEALERQKQETFQKYFQENEKKLEDAKKAGLPILPCSGYGPCSTCASADFDTATAMDDDFCPIICHNPDCECHREEKRKMQEMFRKNQKKLEAAAEAGLPILMDDGYGICCWGCSSADSDTMTDDGDNQPGRIICHNLGCVCHRKMTYADMRKLFVAHETQTPPPKDHLTGRITFTADSFQGQKYSLASRTYEVSSDNKGFQPYMGGYSIYGSALDGSDSDVRLEKYMAEEYGGQAGWVVQECHICERNDALCHEHE